MRIAYKCMYNKVQLHNHIASYRYSVVVKNMHKYNVSCVYCSGMLQSRVAYSYVFCFVISLRVCYTNDPIFVNVQFITAFFPFCVVYY